MMTRSATRVASSLVLCVLALGHRALSGEEAPRSLRFATYNINWGNKYGDQVLEAIAEAKADVLFLQETTLQSEAFLQPRLSGWYPHFYVAGHEGQYAAERYAFASRIPLQDVRFTPPKNGLFGWFSAQCDLAGMQITLINVHLTPLTVLPDSEAGSGGIMSALNATEAKHVAEIEAICAKLDAKQPTIVAGDFNSLSTFAAPSRLRALGFIDSFASVHDDAEAHPTWFWPTRPLPLRARIDYIFHTAHVRTTTSEVVIRNGSDHFLLVSEVRTIEPLVSQTSMPGSDSHNALQHSDANRVETPSSVDPRFFRGNVLVVVAALLGIGAIVAVVIRIVTR